jgi:penicillin-binding protein 2
MFLPRKKKKKLHTIAPDEVFLDAANIPSFDTQQFEGRLERPIAKRAAWGIAFFSLGIFVVFALRLGVLQIKKGDTYLKQSQNNALIKAPIFALRGVLYDRNEQRLAWNTENPDSVLPMRTYIDTPGFSHLLGYVSLPKVDTSGNLWQAAIVGKDGAEKLFNTELSGINGAQLFETDVSHKVLGASHVIPGYNGHNVYLSVDMRIQRELANSIAANVGGGEKYVGGAGVVMDIHTGEIIAYASYPEYDSNIMTKGEDQKTITGYATDPHKPFLDKITAGLYTPGSIVKPYVALGALQEHIIDPATTIFSSGQIEIPNPYFPELPTIFRDNKAHGAVDMRKALAVSSNVYFYEVGGGFKGQKGLGIDNIAKYFTMFGLASKTGGDFIGEVSGTIPTPSWKRKLFPQDPWRIGDTYNTAIGQYGVKLTPLQVVRAVSALANGGYVIEPTLRKSDVDETKSVTRLPIDPKNFTVVYEGMREGVLEGTGVALNFPTVHFATKSGTAQVGISKQKTNSWITGFFPYEHPRYAFTILMESGPKNGAITAAHVFRPVVEYMIANTPEYLQ